MPGSKVFHVRSHWRTTNTSTIKSNLNLTFAHKQGFITLDPEMIVKIDALLTDIDMELVKTQHETEKKKEKELEPWLKKYQLWKKMQGKAGS